MLYPFELRALFSIGYENRCFQSIGLFSEHRIQESDALFSPILHFPFPITAHINLR
jgi:hypothetical protein